MKYQKLLLFVCLQLLVVDLFSQISFINKASLLTPAEHYSGVAIAVIDMNGDGLDDIVRLNQGINLNIQYQTAPNAAFASMAVGNVPNSNNSQWGICTGDIDNNGFADVLTGGAYDGIKIATASADGTAFSMTTLNNPSTFVQGVNFADINNDGWLDAFVCHDDGVSRIYGNNGDGTFTYEPMWIDMATEPPSDNSGNYGSVWSDVDNDGDVDLYIAHCRQGVNDPTDPRRINQLFLNNGDGTYTQDIDDTAGLRIGAQSWTADFGDIDNDGDFDCFITNHDVSSQILENDGAGHFTDISQEAGIFNAIGGTPIQGVFRDFDNDGFVDILVAGNFHYIFKNNGDKTFIQVEGIFDDNIMESFAVGDLNGDGFQDIYGGYAHIYTDPSSTPDALWINEGNDNHFIGFNLRGSQSNKGGVGAKVQLHSSLGIQTREVRSGESYGISNSLQIHFGLGQVETIDSVVVNWPSGVRDVLLNPTRDQYLTLGEGGCLVPAVDLQALGNTTFCTGQSVELSAPTGFNYNWNNGDTTQTISAQVAGEYRVTVTTLDGCEAVSNTIVVTVDPIQIPQISLQGDSIFCAGGSVILTASPSSAYQWSTGETTQTITASETGYYTVATQGLCDIFSSAPLTVTALEAATPVVTPDIVSVDSVATLSATGAVVQWYATDNSTMALATGNTFETPALSQSTTYWVSNTVTYDSPNQFVGMVDHAGAVLIQNSYEGGLIFDCFTPFTLAKVKVYTTKAGNRQINLLSSTGQLLRTKMVDIPVGTTVIEVGMDIPVGTNMEIKTDAAVNQSVLGSNGPQLRRSDQNIDYPYQIPGVVSIKTSNYDETRYYYFYNWEISLNDYVCESERVSVTAEVLTSGTNTPSWAAGVQLYPNPTSTVLNVSCKGYVGGKLLVTLKNVQGVTVQTESMVVPTGSFDFNTDLSQVAKGIYWLELAGDDGVVRRKVVVQ
jgi:hypothetical protein